MASWHRWLVAGALLLPLLCSAAPFERPSADLRAEAVAAGREGKQLAVFMTLPDCPGCLEMERSALKDATVDKRFARGYRSVRLDLAQPTPITDPAGRQTSVADFANRLHVYATPSFVFFNARGEVLFRYTGTLDAVGLLALERHVARADYEKRPFVPPARKVQAWLHADPPGATLPQFPEFRLAGSDGKSHRLADFRGVGVALAVGYTQCPDVCPTTLAELKAAVEALPAEQRRHIQILFATLDPERDSLAVLREYADAFQPRGGRPVLGLRGDAEATAGLIRQLQLVADKQPSASMGYTLDHTAGIFLFGTDGRLLGLSPYGQPLKKLGRDLLSLGRVHSKQRAAQGSGGDAVPGAARAVQ